MFETAALLWVDYISIIVYFIIVLGVGLLATILAKRDSANGYFLAGKSSTWITVGASTFATNVGAPMFVGLAGSAAASGIAVTMYEWHAMFSLLLLGWLFLPVYRASGCYTMPQYLEMRFGGTRIRILMAIICLLLAIIAWITGQLFAGALFLQTVFGWNLYLAVGIILTLTAIYTIFGGLKAVMWTDTIQTAILLIGATAVAVICLTKVGGYEAMKSQYMESAANSTILANTLYGNLSCGIPDKNAMHIFRPADDGNFPWPGMIFGLSILAVYVWCNDQTCVQRSLSAKSINHAKAGLILAAYLKVLSFPFFVIPGMISRVIFPEEIACSDPDTCNTVCGNPSGCSNIAYPLLVSRVLPAGVRGLMMAALLAALMSSLTSVFNSTSTIFTMDIWRHLRPRAPEQELMVVGRVATLVLVIISILWLPILEALQESQFWHYVQEIQSCISPPGFVVFLTGILWTRATEQGAFWSMLSGIIIGAARLALSWSHPAPDCGSGELNTQLAAVRQIHYLHFACISSAVCFIILVVVSLLTKPRPPNKLRRVTFWTRNDPLLPDDTQIGARLLQTTTKNGQEACMKQQGGITCNEAWSSTVTTKDPSSASGWYRAKVMFLKYACGVNLGKPALPVIAPGEVTDKSEIVIQDTTPTSEVESKYWNRIINANAIICVAVAIFIHAFWG